MPENSLVVTGKLKITPENNKIFGPLRKSFIVFLFGLIKKISMFVSKTLNFKLFWFPPLCYINSRRIGKENPGNLLVKFLNDFQKQYHLVCLQHINLLKLKLISFCELF